MLETDTDLFAIQSPITDDELDELIDIYFPPEKEYL
jgi:hypothetical protein